MLWNTLLTRLRCPCVEESFTLRSWCNSASVWAWGIPPGSPPQLSAQRSCWGSDTSPRWGRTWAAAWSWPPGSWSTSSALRSNCGASWSLAHWSQSLVGERILNFLLRVESPYWAGIFISLFSWLSCWTSWFSINDWKQNVALKIGGEKKKKTTNRQKQMHAASDSKVVR